jgi:hypothetical protein
MTRNREKRLSLFCKISRALVAVNATAVLVFASFARWFSGLDKTIQLLVFTGDGRKKLHYRSYREFLLAGDTFPFRCHLPIETLLLAKLELANGWFWQRLRSGEDPPPPSFSMP